MATVLVPRAATADEHKSSAGPSGHCILRHTGHQPSAGMVARPVSVLSLAKRCRSLKGLWGYHGRHDRGLHGIAGKFDLASVVVGAPACRHEEWVADRLVSTSASNSPRKPLWRTFRLYSAVACNLLATLELQSISILVRLTRVLHERHTTRPPFALFLAPASSRGRRMWHLVPHGHMLLAGPPYARFLALAFSCECDGSVPFLSPIHFHASNSYRCHDFPPCAVTGRGQISMPSGPS